MRNLRRLADVLPHAVGNGEILRAARAQSVMRQWPDVVGPLMAQHATADRFDHGTVWVTARSSAWAQEVRLRSEEILTRLNDLSGETGLFEKIRVGSRPARSD